MSSNAASHTPEPRTPQPVSEEDRCGLFDSLSACLYEPLLRERLTSTVEEGHSFPTGEDFLSRSRKAAIATSLVWIPFLLAFIGVWVNALVERATSSNESLAAMICSIIAAALFGTTILIVYFVTRSMKDAPMWLVDVLMGAAVLFCGLMTVCIPSFPADLTMEALAVIIVWSRSPRAPIFVLCCTCIYLIFMYNLSWRNWDWQLIQIPGSYAGRPLEQGFLRLGFCGLAAPLLLLAGKAMIKQFQASVEALQRSVDLAEEVAAQLVLYDTTAVRVTAEAFEAMCDPEDVATHDLIRSFREMANNLDQYRPYLPNWVLAGLDGGVMEEENVVRPPPKKVQPSESASETQGSYFFETPSQVYHSSQQSSDRRTDESYKTDQHDSISTSRTSAAALSARQVAAQQRRIMGKQAEFVPPPFHGRITLVMIDFAIIRPSGVSSVDFRSSKIGLYEQLVSSIHRLASQTGGSIHALICDRCILSWNATARVGAQELKAVRFVTRLRASLSLINEEERRIKKPNSACQIILTGVVLTGRARCQLAGGKKSQSFTIHPRWLRAARALALHAQNEGRLLIDDATRQPITGEFTVTAYDAIMCPSNKTVSTHHNAAAKPLGARMLMRSPMANDSPIEQSEPPRLPSTDQDAQTSLRASTTVQQGQVTANSMEPQVMFEISPKSFNNENDEWMYELQDEDRGIHSILCGYLLRLVGRNRQSRITDESTILVAAAETRESLKKLLDRRVELERELPEHTVFPEEAAFRLLSRAEAIAGGECPWPIPTM